FHAGEIACGFIEQLPENGVSYFRYGLPAQARGPLFALTFTNRWSVELQLLLGSVGPEVL
ncbi:MAG: hypothetical protein V5A87_02870, partial [Candidatus Bipolaricaulota bacterium]